MTGTVTAALIAATLSLHPVNSKLKGNDLYCLSTVVYMEARGEDKRTQISVAHVPITRAKAKREMGMKTNICSVVTKSGQFPWARNRRALKQRFDKQAWEKSVRLAADVLNNKIKDPTRGATHFCHVTEVKKVSWCQGKKAHRLTTGGLRFIYLNESPLLY